MKRTLDNEPDHLQRVASGDETAFSALFEFYWPVMYANVLQFTKDPETAKDLSQEIFVKVWASRHRLTEVQNFRGFLYSMARNLVIDTLRKKVLKADNLDFLEDYFEDKEALPDTVLEAKQLEHILDKAIANLPHQVQQAFVYKRLDGLTHEQIAAKMKISPVSSRSYVARAVNSIREYLEKNPGMIVTAGTVLVLIFGLKKVF